MKYIGGWLVAFCSATFLLAPVTSYAAEENLAIEESDLEGTGVMGITALYSETITPEGSDEFLITLASEDGNIKEYQFNAYEHQEEAQFFELPSANYEVYSITYQGSNEKLASEGFIMPANISIYEADHLDLTFVIGEEKGTELAQTYADTFAVINNKSAEWLEHYTPKKDAISLYETKEEEIEKKDSLETEKADTEPSLDASNKEEGMKVAKPETKSNLFIRNLPLIIVGILVGVVVYILHKKGKV